MGLIQKIFGTYSQRELKSIYPIADKIEALEEEYRALTDEQLQAKTPEFKQRLQQGETLDDILPEAFAAVREAADRVLGLRPYRVQLIGGIVLHQGRIAEMKTGEGKTLVATLPAYLNALTGNGVHIVTVNDYLAKRDSEWMGKVHRFMGLTVGLIVHDLTKEQRQAAYAADITYGTNNEMGFDYLRDNMAIYKNEQVQRGHSFAIVDEVDSILIDEARTPLIISGMGEKSTQLYDMAESFACRLKKYVVTETDDKEAEDETLDADYIVDEKARTATLTARGIAKAEEFFHLDNLSDPENSTIAHHINQAIKAHGTMKRDVDYVVKDGEIIIVDEFTGRLMFGRRYSEGLHQAIEAKEHVSVQRESKTLATITFQNYFRLYSKLSGMTGTAMTEEEEFATIYKLDIVEIPTNRPVVRIDNEDAVYKTEQGKYRAVIRQVKECHEKGQPVLVGTVSIEKNELLSRMLTKEGIKHNLLNAKNHEKEAEIVAQAGQFGAVTVATNMAGRGTDIMLGGNVEFLADAKLKSEGYSPEDTPEEYEKRWPGTLNEIKAQVKDEHEEVKELGGLYVLGTERHESRRIDNQLRGRSGRQGDPGESRFYLSLEDDLMRLFNTQLVAQVMAKGMEEGQPIEAKSVTKGVRTAQKAVESRNYEIRKNVLKYDDVMNKQRTVIYSERQAVLKGEDIHKDILRFISDTVESYIKGANKGSEKPKDWDWEGLFKALNTVIPTKVDEDEVRKIVGGLKGAKAVEAVRDLIVEDARQQYGEMEETIGETGLRDLERRVVLAVLDRKWREHLYEMDYLKDGIGLRGMGQRDPLVEYQREGYQMYNSMIEAIKEETVQLLFHIDIKQVATTDEAVDEVEETAESADTIAVASGPDENGESVVEAAEGEVEEEDEDTDAKQAIAESAAASGAGESTLPVAGPAPISHAEGKVPVSKRPKSEELKTPWADGRTFPGTGKNAPCPCGSGRKYKMCHGQNEK